MTTTHPPLSRKEIAQLLGGKISVWTISRREREWGLDRARLRLRTRTVLYSYSQTVDILRRNGVEI